MEHQCKKFRPNEEKTIPEDVTMRVLKKRSKRFIDQRLCSAKFEVRRKNLASLLVDAIKTQDIAQVKQYLSGRASVNEPDEHGETPIFHAVRSGCVEVVALLIENGANIHVRVYDKFPLLCAFYQKNTPIICLLLQHQKTDFLSTYEKQTLLCLAIQFNLKTVVEVMIPLLETVCFDKPHTPMCVAVKHGHLELIELLLQENYDLLIKNCCFISPLDVALGAHKMDVAHALLDYGAVYEIDVWHSKEEQHFLLLHTVKLKALNINNNNQQNVEFLRSEMNGEFEKYEGDCKKEILKLKKRKISKSFFVTYYDILRKKLDKVVLLLRNENIKNALTRINIRKSFPIYGSMLERRIKYCLQRNNFFEKGRRSIQEILHKMHLPEECVDMIYSYFTKEDVKNLLSTCI